MSEKPDQIRQSMLERLFPEKRIFLKSEDTTRVVRLGPAQQILAWLGGLVFLAWSVTATSMVLIALMTGSNLREQAVMDREVYETRLNALAQDRNRRIGEAVDARALYAEALRKVSTQQEAMLDAQMALEESRRGTEALRRLLVKSLSERDALEQQMALLEDETGDTDVAANARNEAVVEYLTEALTETAEERDLQRDNAEEKTEQLAELRLDMELAAEDNDRIFKQLEKAVTVSLEPLEQMFRDVGIPPEQILSQMRNRYAGEGGPLAPIAISTSGAQTFSPEAARANEILAHMSQIGHYSAAAQGLPFAKPVSAGVRETSGFGYRRDPIRGGTRLHSGLDWAGPYGTPIFATGDGVVTHAGWQSGYGRLIKIQHEFGIATRYAHLANINVKVGQRVSRGDRIGAMGNSGRSTGTHLHYEIRVGDQPINPKRYLRAAENVF